MINKALKIIVCTRDKIGYCPFHCIYTQEGSVKSLVLNSDQCLCDSIQVYILVIVIYHDHIVQYTKIREITNPKTFQSSMSTLNPIHTYESSIYQIKNEFIEAYSVLKYSDYLYEVLHDNIIIFPELINEETIDKENYQHYIMLFDIISGYKYIVDIYNVTTTLYNDMILSLQSNEPHYKLLKNLIQSFIKSLIQEHNICTCITENTLHEFDQKPCPHI